MKPKELEGLIKMKRVMVVDVRERKEYQKEKGIKGSKNIPMGQFFLDANKLSKRKKIVSVCMGGGRCKIVARELRKKGFNIDHLEGGIKAWKKYKEK